VLLDNAAVEQCDGPVRARGITGIVCDHADGRPIVMQLAQQTHDRFTVLGVKVARRLVSKQDGGMAGESACHSDALLLAAIGIYGVLSYAVTARTREIGIRISLGATQSRVLRGVVAEGMRLAVIGFVIGVAGAFAAGRVLASMLHEDKPGDPVVFVVTAGLLAVVALAACYLPARRAARLDPMVALREE